MQTAAAHEQPGTVGHLLRNWRAARGMSQLDLALQAGFSARHVSFIETGRSRPSRQALLVLAEALEVPLRERNRLLQAGGYAQVYSHTPLEAGDMEHIRGVLQFIIDRHKPYAAVVLDRYSTCLMGNGVSERFLAALVDPALLQPQANLLRLVFHPRGARRHIVNWAEVSRHLLARAERELEQAKDDETAVALLAELREYGGGSASPAPLSAGDLLLPVHIRAGTAEFRLFSTIMTLGTPQDVTLQELRVETFFPADRESEATWMRLMAAQ